VLGRKPFYMGCVVLFTISSLLCGLAPSLSLLIVFRVLQGLGGGGLAPSAASILRDSFPERQQGMVFALYGIVIVAAPALGPTFGGWLTDHYSWHWVFLINIPVGIAALGLSFWLLTEPELETRERHERRQRGLRIDYIGFILVALGLGCLQVVLDRGERADWFSSLFILCFSAIAAVSLISLVIRELTIEDPVVDLPLLRDRGFLAANIVRFGTFFVLVGSTQLLPQMTQNLFDYNAMTAGLVLTPGALVVMLITPISGFLINKVQVRLMIGFGLLLEAAALWHMSGFTTEISFAHIHVGADLPGDRACLPDRADHDHRLRRHSRRQEQRRLGAAQPHPQPRRQLRRLVRPGLADQPLAVPPEPPDRGAHAL
jgi:MFS transporter, DHA2 family, multidrug resistance protein